MTSRPVWRLAYDELSRQLCCETAGEPDVAAIRQWLAADEIDRALRTRRAFTIRVQAVRASLAGDRKALWAVIRCPQALLAALVGESSSGAGPGDGSPFRVGNAWAAAVWTFEAAAELLGAADPVFAPGEWNLLAPRIIRTRFILLSFPFRLGAQQWSHVCSEDFVPAVLHDVSARAGRWPFDNALVDACRTARALWVQCLDEQHSHVWLAARPVEAVEEDLRRLVLVANTPGLTRRGPLTLRTSPERRAGEPVAPDTRPPTVLDSALATHLVQDHFLPRAMLSAVHWTAVCYGPSSPRRRGTAGQPPRYPGLARWRWPVLVCLVVALFGASLAAAAHRWFTAGAALAAATYLAVGAIAMTGGPRWTHPWLLRQPATAALGCLVLVTLSPHWWLSGAWSPGLALLVAAGGYLIIDLRNHDVAPLTAATRGGVVAAAGMMHSFLISLLFLRAVAPWFAQDSDRPPASLVGWWTRNPTVPNLGSMLWLATTWCFTAGVLSQVLWDDRPITAPLGRLEWKRR